ncbi:Asp/Glu/hydantoin racemase [Stachybotrys elegans]|uniref:Asp/Glu/hydantoin racemase n=1 Tax=Stachybotrys elegans TaxID=80388 RepID=A0A8K0SL64_9HYPO|nr:Asp/Glu/hydantoin racemase [Stachybotrys elegans]
MKTVLLLGGMTPDVTVLYYNIINRVVRAQLGGRHGAPLYLYSADLEAMIQHLGRGDVEAFARTYTDPIAALASRVDAVVICAILAHKVAAQIRASLPAGVSLIHIADVLASHVKARYPGVRRLGLLGPKATMLGGAEPDFFVAPLQAPEHGFEVLVPETEEAIEEVNRGMLEEVAKGAAAVTPETKAMFVEQARSLVRRGAQAIVLGSTDLGFVLTQEDVGEMPVIEPAAVHAEHVGLWVCQ